MILSKISLLNFRNYSKLSLAFDRHLNIIVGDNAQGKTNILESIYILALTKSHRMGLEANYIQFGKDHTKIKGTIKVDRVLKDLTIELSEKEKHVFVNQTEIKKISEYIANLNVILFTPDDLEIIKGSPSIRRNLLNIQMSQISKSYLKIYNEYNKILKTRNEYLKMLYINNLADENYLNILTDQLIEKAIYIYKKRKEYIDLINQKIATIYQNITDLEGLMIHYEPNVDFVAFEDEELRSKLRSIFQKNYKRELMQGMTLYGPHRDDFSFYLGAIDLKFYGSQGQQKLAILSYKLSEVDVFTEVTGTHPVLLLDYIFSEIDIKKRNRLLKYIDQDIQSIITTTDLKNIQKKVLEHATIFEIKQGSIVKKER